MLSQRPTGYASAIDPAAKLLKISVAGVRGVVGKGMNADTAMSFAQAFATYLEGEPIAIARDSRPSGSLMRSAVLGGALACGSRVVDLGVVPTPSARLSLERLGVAGEIVIAAGHNPWDWNALKFVREDGMYLTARQGEELLEIYHHGEYRKARWDRIHPLEEDDAALEHHLARIESVFDVEAIRARRFKVALDCCNGVCSLLSPPLLERLGCEVVVVNDELGKPFPRAPNPTPDNMSLLKALVRAVGADIGFAHDAEGERLGVVSERGVALRQDDSFALACLIGLEGGRCQGPIVTNLSTSAMVDDIAAAHGRQVHRTPIGQAHVADVARQLQAGVAGEGSGQIILPFLHYGPDSFAAIAFFLEHLAHAGTTVSKLLEQLPRLHLIKENLAMPADRLFRTLQEFRAEAAKRGSRYQLDLSDGIRLSSPDAWVQVRVSSTEPLLRIITEAREQSRAEQLHGWAREVVLR